MAALTMPGMQEGIKKTPTANKRDKQRRKRARRRMRNGEEGPQGILPEFIPPGYSVKD